MRNFASRRLKKTLKNQKKSSGLGKKFAKYGMIGAAAWASVNYYLPSLAIDERASMAFENAANEYLHWDDVKRTTSIVLMRDFERPTFGVDDNGALDNISLMGGTAESNYFGPLSDRWYAMMGRHEVLMQNPVYRKEFGEWLSQLDEYRDNGLLPISIEERAKAVDALVDREIRYVTDDDNYNAFDYWASPLETIKRGFGDCDDFAILKYYALRYLGVDEDRLYMVAVGPEGTDTLNHATLIVDTAGRSLWDQAIALLPGFDLQPDFAVLDNDNSTTGRLIEAGDSGYRAHYAMNERGYWSVRGQKLIK